MTKYLFLLPVKKLVLELKLPVIDVVSSSSKSEYVSFSPKKKKKGKNNVIKNKTI